MLVRLLSTIYKQSSLTGAVPVDWRLANMMLTSREGQKEDPGKL